MTPKRVCITFLDFQGEKGRPDLTQLELVVRLVERDLLTNPAHAEVNCMYVECKEQGKIYWQEEMRDLDLMIQLKVLKNKSYLGSISFPFKDLFDQFEQMQQWFTVFDALDDDVFDGNLGEDDSENPKVLVAFEIGEDEEVTETELTMTQQDENSGIIQHQKAKSESRKVLESSKEKRDSEREVKLTTGSVHHRSSGNHSNPGLPKDPKLVKKSDVHSPRNPPTPPSNPVVDSKQNSQGAKDMKKPQSLKDNLHQITDQSLHKEGERSRNIDGYTENRRSDTKNPTGRSSSPNVTPYQNPVPPLPLSSLAAMKPSPAPAQEPSNPALLQKLADLESLISSRDFELDKYNLIYPDSDCKYPPKRQSSKISSKNWILYPKKMKTSISPCPMCASI